MSSEHAIQYVLKWSFFQPVLQLKENHVEKFLSILLDGNIHRLSSVILERKTEFSGIVTDSVAEFEIGEHFLDLMQNIIINLASFIFNNILLQVIFSCDESESKSRSHKELL